MEMLKNAEDSWMWRDVAKDINTDSTCTVVLCVPYESRFYDCQSYRSASVTPSILRILRTQHSCPWPRIIILLHFSASGCDQGLTTLGWRICCCASSWHSSKQKISLFYWPLFCAILVSDRSARPLFCFPFMIFSEH